MAYRNAEKTSASYHLDRGIELDPEAYLHVSPNNMGRFAEKSADRGSLGFCNHCPEISSLFRKNFKSGVSFSEPFAGCTVKKGVFHLHSPLP